MATDTPILGELTTTWTPPSQCAVAVAQCSTCALAWQAQECPGGTSVQDDAGCWPPRTRNVATPVPLMDWGVYSPGIACPAGYTTACTHDGSKQRGDFSFHWRPQSSETAVGCCPVGFKCAVMPDYNNAQTCTRVATTGSVLTALCEAGAMAVMAEQTVPFVVTDSQGATTAVRALDVKAPLFQLVFQASDLPGFVSSSSKATTSTTLSPGSSSSIPTQTGSTTLSPTGSSPDASGAAPALSNGQVAGIAVGATLGAVGLVGGLIMALCYKRWKRRQESKYEMLQRQYQHMPPPPSSGTMSYPDSAALSYYGGYVAHDHTKAWAGGQPYHVSTELPSHVSTELPSSTPPLELDSSRR
ncbi:uncharacterized protein B0I36DRAFT_387393 [Microdochium trichocladiopsis]|uniref:Uncharacterized protein n=1 Tax=Microdochium trichocladiopsis TaxID=1682393 RepID=A0A9P9BPY4_9PEZI|nr:uncharacterized protein B0I36DRAFT_387393 [Microdochium trichocladiopsis]KAH7025001.1 hypothetical protein B0I36DRAFT_387393 [Microdochium trichocladiopsis]